MVFVAPDTRHTLTDAIAEILHLTHDGNDLCQDDLYMCKYGANYDLNEYGLRALADLKQRVVSGTYERPYMYGIEHLMREHDGYVSWRGQIVEHYSFRGDRFAERVAAKKLARLCRSYEKRGFPVNCATIHRDNMHDAPMGTPWLLALSRFYTVFSNDEEGTAHTAVFYDMNGDAVAISMNDELPYIQREKEQQYESGVYLMFHRLQDAGMHSVSVNTRTYGGFVQAMTEAGLTPEIVNAAIEKEK